MVATLLAQFFKVVKNELQLKREGAETGEYKTNFPDVLNILKSESDRGLFAGPSAGFMHQATFKQPECSTYNVLCVQPMKEDETSLYFFMRSLVGSLRKTTSSTFGAVITTIANTAIILKANNELHMNFFLTAKQPQGCLRTRGHDFQEW
ncbi:mitochondrial 2-oxoglutarate/malate carrier protein-like isoform X2 [Notamacropus eugenii]|uniref:mitochondrial 2-oxoglutarate/malate carrier protein-like isoform X2 n=1 Tax=Notamacropus eugenii TaxID=9315 RepID=UPI003B66F12A